MVFIGECRGSCPASEARSLELLGRGSLRGTSRPSPPQIIAPPRPGPPACPGAVPGSQHRRRRGSGEWLACRKSCARNKSAKSQPDEHPSREVGQGTYQRPDRDRGEKSGQRLAWGAYRRRNQPWENMAKITTTTQNQRIGAVSSR